MEFFDFNQVIMSLNLLTNLKANDYFASTTDNESENSSICKSFHDEKPYLNPDQVDLTIQYSWSALLSGNKKEESIEQGQVEPQPTVTEPQKLKKQPFNIPERTFYLELGQDSLNLPYVGKAKKIVVYDGAGLGSKLKYKVKKEHIQISLSEPVTQPGNYKILLRDRDGGVIINAILREQPKSQDNPIDLSDRE